MQVITNLSGSLVSVDWLKTNHNAPNLVIFDATINKVIETTTKRILKARFFDIKKKFSAIDARFPSTLPSKQQFQEEARGLGINNDSVIVVYDDKGIYSSARAWWLFKTFGFKNVAVLDGGQPEWELKGYSLNFYNEETYSYGNFEAVYNPHLMTDFNGVNTFAKDSKYLILDARSEVRFKCLVDEPRVGLRRGTIPNSVNLPYTVLLNSNIMKSKAELSTIFNNLVQDKTNLVFSCGSGITACVLALAATICNYKNLIVYDGSWTEYGTLTD